MHEASLVGICMQPNTVTSSASVHGCGKMMATGGALGGGGGGGGGNPFMMLKNYDTITKKKGVFR